MKSKIVILDDSVLLYENYMGNDEWEKVNAFPRGGLTYLIRNNNIKFFAYIDYFYRNCLASMELPLYIIDETMGIDGEYDDIQEITDILNRIFPTANGDVDLNPYLKIIDAEATYQHIGDYLTKESGDTLYQPLGDYVTDDELEDVLDDYYTKDESDAKYQPTGDYALKSDIPEVPSLDGYATEIWVENKGYLTEHQPIKTINGYSLIGEGNIIIEGGSGGTIDAYTKTEADNRFQPIGNYATENWVLNKNYVTYSTLVQNINNLQEQINYLISEISGCCGSSGETQYRWITMTGENDYICSGVTKYSKEKKQQSTDGITWTDVTPAEYRTGSVIESASTDCGYTGDTTIVGDAEYRKQDLSGNTWPIHITYSGDPSQITYDYSYPSESVSNNRGLILDKSTGTITLSGGVCYLTSKMAWFRISVKVNGSEVKRVTVYPEDKYITLTGQYTCDGYNKYQLYQEQHSYDNSTWCDWLSPSTRDNMTLLEENSVDCGYVPPTPEPQYRWYQASASDYVCSGTSKYYKEYYQVSNDGGQTWTNVTPEQTRQGSLIETQSTDCGYVPSFDGKKYSGVTTANTEGYYDCNCDEDYDDPVCKELIPHELAYVFNPRGVGKMKSVTVGDCVEVIGISCFNEETNLLSLTLPSTLTAIKGTLLGGCKSIQSLTLFSTTPPIFPTIQGSDSSLFYFDETPPAEFKIYVPCNSVDAYKSADEWSKYANRIIGINCADKKITANYINGTVKSLDCDSTSSLTRRNIETNLGNNTSIVSATVGDCVTILNGVVFGSCSAMTSIVLPETITYIDSYAFQNCQSLSSITIPSKVTEIKQGTFIDCYSLSNVRIQSGVTNISNMAFSNCSGLTNITIEATTPPTLGGAVFMHTNDTFKIYVPAASVNAYKSASGWSDYSSRIQAIS